MGFKNAAQRGAFFEKQKQKNGMAPSTPSPGMNPANKLNDLSQLAKLPKAPSLPALKPLGSFEKLKRSIKMPKAGY